MWSFTITPDYPADACTAAWWAMQDWKSKGKTGAPGWAWFTLDIPFGRAPIKPESEAYIKSLGFNIVGTWTMPFVPVDTGSQFRSMIDAGANYCYGNLVVLQQQKLMKDVTRLGLKDKIQVVACPYGIMEEIIKVAGTDAEGLAGVHFAAFPDDLNKPGVSWAHKITEKYDHPWTTDAILGCAIGKIMLIALERALTEKGYPISGDDVYKAMLSLDGFDTGGLMPHMKFSKDERRGVWTTHMRGVQGGKIVRISEDFQIPDVKPGGPWTPK
jgi:branched-chain amino acid transport system substrate-binding protein